MLEGLFMTESKFHVYVPSMDGEYVPVKFTSRAEDLKDTEVLIFLDEEKRQIYIWTGENSSVRKRFISSQIARQMRLEKGMTHRISTEDQGNETIKFKDFMIRLEASPVSPSSLLDVTPAVQAASIKEIAPPPKTAQPKKAKIATDKSKGEKVIKPVSPPPPPISKTKPKEVKAKERVELKEEKETSILYFAADEDSEVTNSKAKLLYPASKSETTLTMLHASSAATEGKIVLYSIKRNTKTATCKTATPIFVIYLSPNMNSVQALDDLEIPIAASYSIYYTCPGNTFLGINLE
ncbi:hypothetical protein CEE45_07245 [Candidatus Heimdallarchaeota archaeon B3_Heim]|nr:MAG: hypothetical protein CEE45_07245 [Candidatus Heimdallarchaeota archaeon B3_Heim]